MEEEARFEEALEERKRFSVSSISSRFLSASTFFCLLFIYLFCICFRWFAFTFDSLLLYSVVDFVFDSLHLFSVVCYCFR